MIALLPGVPGEEADWRETAAELAAYGFAVRIVRECPPDDVTSDLDLAGMWVAHCALELARDQQRHPVVLVARGTAGRFLAAMGFAQRAARRRVVSYVFVEAELPNPGVEDWPDAPVTFLGESSLAGLRGWDVMPADDIGAALRTIAARSI